MTGEVQRFTGGVVGFFFKRTTTTQDTLTKARQNNSAESIEE